MAIRFRRLAEIDDEIRAIGDELQTDEQLGGLVCPFCKGGRTGERTFSAKRTFSGVAFTCHRASCGEKGYVDMLRLEHKTDSKPKARGNPINGMIFSKIPDAVREMLRTKYHIDDNMFFQAGIRWIENMKRIGIPIKRSTGISMGLTARSVDPQNKPKSLIFLHTPDTVLGAFYMHNNRTKRIWLVEDQFSAMRVAEYDNAVALLGTNLSESLVAELKRLDISEIVVCLDADAFEKTVNIGLKYKGVFGHILIKKPTKDLKDMAREELQKFVKEK